jgi:hypothetical protein
MVCHIPSKFPPRCTRNWECTSRSIKSWYGVFLRTGHYMFWFSQGRASWFHQPGPREEREGKYERWVRGKKGRASWFHQPGPREKRERKYERWVRGKKGRASWFHQPGPREEREGKYERWVRGKKGRASWFHQPGPREKRERKTCYMGL